MTSPPDQPSAMAPIETSLTDFDLVSQPLLNKGTAFTEEERDTFKLHGLLPPQVGTIEDQISRRLKALRRQETDFDRYALLRDLQDVNETLFYAFLKAHIVATMPIVYTPTVGEGCQRFSEIWRKPRGLFLSYPNKARIQQILANPRFDSVRVIVVSDGERILGLGDQGAGGMGIPIGKLSLYTALAGIHPSKTLPILLDVGTDNEERLRTPIYIGWRHGRIRGVEYDDFIEAFIEAVCLRWPNVLLQWEDFAGANAGRLLQRYRDRLCTFNDDVQGTAAVAAGTLLAAINVTGVPLSEQRIALLGAGSAGCGIASLLLQAMVDEGSSLQDARSRFFAIDRPGLLVEGMKDLHPAQVPFVQPRDRVAGWTLRNPDRIDLFDVTHNAKPTTLIGVTGQAGAFTAEVVREMAAHVERPVIFPLSNPTSRSEANPKDLLAWTEGRALVGTGSPFPGVTQTNNSYIFPGVGLAVLATGASRVTDAMFMAAAKALSALSPARSDKDKPMLPPVDQLRSVSVAIARAVARQAMADGLAAPLDDEALEAQFAAEIWEPVYRPYRLAAR